MFGKKKNKDAGAGSGSSGKDETLQYLDRQKTIINLRYELQTKGGVRAQSTVTSLAMTFEMARSEFDDDLALHPEQEWTIQADVPTDDGSSFLATFLLSLDEFIAAPQPGDPMFVYFDPNDRSRIVADELWDPKMPGNQPGFGNNNPVRWKVPELCPNCGARVDQSTASLAEHPTCAMCNSPLPCEPYA